MTIHITVRSRTWPRRMFLAVACCLVSSIGQGCSLADLVDVDPLALGNAVSAKDAQTYSAAVMLYNQAVGVMAQAWSAYSQTSGIWTDELTDGTTNGQFASLDTRDTSAMKSAPATVYRSLHESRVSALIAIERFRQFKGGQSSTSLVSELYSIQAAALTLFAEGYCSGIPVSAATLDGDVTYSRGLTTEQLLRRAIPLYDSALVNAGDSIRLRSFALVGLARAYLNLGEYDSAVYYARQVDRLGTYELSYDPTNSQLKHWSTQTTSTRTFTVDREGDNGLVWVGSAPDVRVPVSGGIQMKFANVRSASFATYTEAALIEAEARLNIDHDGNRWLEMLNELRAEVLDGSGSRTLPDLEDPGTYERRVDLLFRERALWLFGTGHRLGDLRRLVRQYGRPSAAVFPWGDYSSVIYPRYSEHLVFEVPSSEITLNPEYNGCHDTDA